MSDSCKIKKETNAKFWGTVKSSLEDTKNDEFQLKSKQKWYNIKN